MEKDHRKARNLISRPFTEHVAAYEAVDLFLALEIVMTWSSKVAVVVHILSTVATALAPGVF